MKARGTECKLLFAARTQLVQWTDADAKAALAEGWGLFLTTANGIMRIGRIAKGPLVRFPHDRAAIAHVKRKVDERSDIHRRAWLLEEVASCPWSDLFHRGRQPGRTCHVPFRDRTKP